MQRNRQQSSILRSKPVLALLVMAAVAISLALLRVGPAPELDIQAGLPGIGPATPIIVSAREPGRGLSSLQVELLQGEQRVTLAEEQHQPRPFWAFWGPRTAETTLQLVAGREHQPELVEGEATLRVTADRAGTWLRRPRAVVSELVLPVRFKPPALGVTSGQNYLAQGGSAVVTYQVADTSTRDGVQVGEDLFFPGYPLPGGGPTDRFALFGSPYDLGDAADIALVAEDALGNRARRGFLDRFIPRPPTTDIIRLDDRFLSRVVPLILANTPELEDQGDLLQTYLTINRELRQDNAETLTELAKQTRDEFLWRRPFKQLPGSQSMASYADRRSYRYQGQEVDRQVHLGFDLASFRQAPVLAANRGVVVLARYLGIYGNTVVIDHGYGLMSLYSHLSFIQVEAGQTVEHGETLGRTGETGLAGGDHLHFSMLLHGLQVNPLEWWDRKWIEDRVASKLGSALQLEDS